MAVGSCGFCGLESDTSSLLLVIECVQNLVLTVHDLEQELDRASLALGNALEPGVGGLVPAALWSAHICIFA